jgi:hypothetical protein
VRGKLRGRRRYVCAAYIHTYTYIHTHIHM